MRPLKAPPFFVMAIGGTWLFWVIPTIAEWPIWEAPAVWFLYAGGASVPLTAVLLVWRFGQLKLLARRLIDPRLVPGRWWVFILLFVPVVHLLSGAITAMFALQGAPVLPSSAADMTAAQLLSSAAFLLLLGPLPEEIGWRGYALPALLDRHSAIASTISLGAAWCIWHVPLFFLAGYYEPFGGPPEPLLFFANILIISVFYTWIFMHTGGSILAAILFHFSVNFTGELFSLSAAGELVKTAVLAVIAMTVVASRKEQWMNRRSTATDPSS